MNKENKFTLPGEAERKVIQHLLNGIEATVSRDQDRWLKLTAWGKNAVLRPLSGVRELDPEYFPARNADQLNESIKERMLLYAHLVEVQKGIATVLDHGMEDGWGVLFRGLRIAYGFKVTRCVIENAEHSWQMTVDGRTLTFLGMHQAHYFALHYHSLGYDVRLLNCSQLADELAELCNYVFRQDNEE